MNRLRTLALAAATALLVGGLVGAADAGPPPRAGKADVSVTLKVQGGTEISGKVTSAKKSCVKSKSAVLIAQDSSGVVIGGATFVTDNQGRYDNALKAVRQTTFRAFVVVPGFGGCDVAQSGRESVTPKAGPANVKVSFSLGDTGLHGKVTSADKSCTRRVPVIFLIRFGSDPWQYANLSVRTNKQGKYSFDGSRRIARGGSGSAIAIVPAQRGCDVAQSPTQGA